MTKTRMLGGLALLGLGATAWLGLFVTPPDEIQGENVRLLYVHPPIAWTMYLAFGICALASVLYLLPATRSRLWDLLAGSSAEIGVVFGLLTLATGSLWGRPTWGVWWTWDARLTSTALLVALFAGYLALRRVPADVTVRSKRAAVAALIAIIDLPIVHFSVLWWRTLHQAPTVLRPDLSPQVHGSMAWTMLLGFVSMTLLFSWLLIHRFRLEQYEERLETDGLDLAIEARRAEGRISTGAGAGTGAAGAAEVGAGA